MSKFQVGRRVRKRGTAKKGFITFLNTDWLAADVKWDDPAYEGGSSTVSFELLKLLKPRAVKPAQAKVWTMHYRGDELRGCRERKYTGQSLGLIASDHTEIHVREILPGQVVVDKEALIKAYRDSWKVGADHVPDFIWNALGGKDGK